MSLYNLAWYGWIILTLAISSVAWNIFAVTMLAAGKAKLRSLSSFGFLGMAILIVVSQYLMGPQ